MALFSKKSKQDQSTAHQVIFYTYPKLLFTWPLILVGYALGIVDRLAGAGDAVGAHVEVLAWIWAVVLVVTLLTIGIDLGRNAMAFWVVAFLALLMLGLWLTDAKKIPVFRQLHAFFA